MYTSLRTFRRHYNFERSQVDIKETTTKSASDCTRRLLSCKPEIDAIRFASISGLRRLMLSCKPEIDANGKNKSTQTGLRQFHVCVSTCQAANQKLTQTVWVISSKLLVNCGFSNILISDHRLMRMIDHRLSHILFFALFPVCVNPKYLQMGDHTLMRMGDHRLMSLIDHRLMSMIDHRLMRMIDYRLMRNVWSPTD